MVQNLTDNSHLLVSFIIPCYNSGHFLPEALESIKLYATGYNYEVVIINDGSTDQITVDLLNQLKTDNYIILNQENKGPAAARNAGVTICKGEYILLLDSDNKIRKEFLSVGADILNNDPKIDIVHGKANFFGDTTEPRFNTGPFDMVKMLRGNYIDNCVMMRAATWRALGGQDESRVIISHEDWEFWIRAGIAGYRFQYVDKVLFDYRVLDNSLVGPSMVPAGYQALLSYVYGKHAFYLNKYYSELYNLIGIYQDDMRRPIRSIVKLFIKKYFKN